MKKIVISFLIGALTLGMLVGCRSRDEDTSTDKVVQRMDDADEKEDADKSGEDEAASLEESILDHAEVYENGSETNSYEGEPVAINIGGFQVQIPGEYGCFIDEVKGPVVYRDDLFVLLFLVRDVSYEERMKEPEKLMDGAIDSGGTITKEIEEVKIDGKPYAYFTYTNDGDRFLVVYTAAADSDKRLNAQILIQSEEITDEEVLKRWAAIASTAVETDEPDTTQDDLDGSGWGWTGVDTGEEKEESTLEYKGNAVTFKVEPGYYSTYTDSDETWALEYFSNGDIELECYLKPDEYGGGAEYNIQLEAGFTMDEDAAVETVKVGDHTFYYMIFRYAYNDSDFQRIEAACDIGDGYIYQVSLCAIDHDKEIQTDDIKSFLTVKEK